MFRNKSASSHDFAMIPRADIPRSSFRMQKALKTTFDAGLLIPCFCEEVLPGDTWKLRMTAFARLATPLFPFMDNLHFETFFFFVPNRLVWSNWRKFMGEQANPADSISYNVPVDASAVGGYPSLSIADYFGVPCTGQTGAGATMFPSALPFRGYYLIYNEWFRDQNLQNSFVFATGDGPDALGGNLPLRRGKRHDYFTSALPFTQKGASVPLALAGNAIVKTSASAGFTGAQQAMALLDTTGAAPGTFQVVLMVIWLKTLRRLLVLLPVFIRLICMRICLLLRLRLSILCVSLSRFRSY